MQATKTTTKLHLSPLGRVFDRRLGTAAKNVVGVDYPGLVASLSQLPSAPVPMARKGQRPGFINYFPRVALLFGYESFLTPYVQEQEYEATNQRKESSAGHTINERGRSSKTSERGPIHWWKWYQGPLVEYKFSRKNAQSGSLIAEISRWRP